MPLRDLLFSSQGRIPRSTWWYFRLAVAGIMVGLSVVAVMISALIGGSLSASDSSAVIVVLLCVGVPAYLLIIVTDIMVSIKRCHDRNRSGWFLLWSYIPSIIYSVFSWLFVMPASISYGYDPSSMDNVAILINCAMSLVTFATGLWVLIELGFLKGTAGPNQYGPDPTIPAAMQGYPAAGQAGFGQAGTIPPGPAQMGYGQPGYGQPGAIPPGVIPPEVQPPEGGIRSGQIKQCAYCGEAIEAEAAFCKYCGRAQV
jgi:uncharacterized membrane protein YhaH (DUF805 family)